MQKWELKLDGRRLESEWKRGRISVRSYLILKFYYEKRRAVGNNYKGI